MDVRLPKLGEGADSGTVVTVLVKEGDSVTKGQTLIELENEKAVAPIPSPAAGTVGKLRVKEGDKISVGHVILALSGASGEDEEAPSKPSKAKAKSRPDPEAPEEEDDADDEATEEPEAEEDGGDEESEGDFPPPASPSLRKVARDLGINLRRVKGSKRGGRIVLEDVHAYIQKLQNAYFSKKTGKRAPAAPAPQSIDFSQWGEINKKPMTTLRQTISRRMVENWNSIPHVTQFEEADITDMMALRKEKNPQFEKSGAKLTLTPLALKCVADTLKKHPIFNASIDEGANEIVFKEYIHIGLAVDTEAGLIVPVIRDVDKKNLLDLAKEVNALAVKARERKLSADDLKGGSFTISNQGGIGGAHFTPIVNKPEVAILGLGRGIQKPLVVNNKVEPRLALPLALSYDHRLIDGGAAARFIADLKEAFENFPADSLKL